MDKTVAFLSLFCFYNDVHPVPRATRDRELQSIKHSLYGYVRKIMINPRLEQVKSVMIRKASSWVSVP